MWFRFQNGATANLNINKGKFPIRDKESSKSKFQYNLGQTILSLYPNYDVLEEFYVPKEYLYIDFFIPKLGLAFEAQGKQHEEFNLHFHKNEAGFIKSKVRDQKKKDWCEINEINLITVPYGKIEKEKIKILINKSYK